MPRVAETVDGLGHIHRVLRLKKTVVTKVAMWRIPHRSDKKDVALKIGRYKRNADFTETLECAAPKSELTLDNEEFQNLVAFLNENYEPFREGAREYIPLDEGFDSESVRHLRAVFDSPNRQDVLKFVVENEIIPDDLVRGLEHRARVRAIEEFEAMLADDLVEPRWQSWFQRNDWVLGSDFVRVLDERRIDTDNIADFLLEAFDGFLDIVELKRPEGNLRFWAGQTDHGNYYPAADLTKAIAQVTEYLLEVEREANSVKFLERVDRVKTIKPRSFLVFGRSNEWSAQQHESYRVLNASYHNLTILTYDHVLSRARRMLGVA